MIPALRSLLALGCGCLFLVSVAVVHGAPPLSAAQLAREQVEVRRIEREFVTEVATRLGLASSVIEGLLPAEPRIADRGKHLIQAIGKEIRTLSAAEREAVLLADERRRRALAGLRAR